MFRGCREDGVIYLPDIAGDASVSQEMVQNDPDDFLVLGAAGTGHGVDRLWVMVVGNGLGQ